MNYTVKNNYGLSVSSTNLIEKKQILIYIKEEKYRLHVDIVNDLKKNI